MRTTTVLTARGMTSRGLAVSPAAVPTTPDEPGLALTMLSGLLAGLAVGLAGALVLSRARPTVDSVDDVVSAGATVLRAPDDEVQWTVLADPEGKEFCAFTRSEG